MTRRHSIRLRLALWCAGLVTAAGAIVVVGVLALTGQILHNRALPPTPVPGFPPTVAQAVARAGLVQRGTVVNQTLAEVRVIGLIVVGALALGSVGIGWIVAGRMLSPVTRLAETAHEVSERSLDRRIALEGPADELKSLADAFDAMLDRLDRAFAGQRRFVADASHELRTPMATIRAEVESVLEDGTASAEETAAAAARITKVLDRGDALVSALLTLSRSDAIQARAQVDLAEIAREVVTATPGTGQLQLRPILEPAPVSGDATLLARLTGNLVENAVRYNVPGGLLAVSTATRNGSSVLSVVNDGPLLRAEELPSLLERFHRRSRAAGGVGLGLAIADAISRGHGGSLTLHARPEGGLEAIATLPAAGPLRRKTV